MLKNEDTCENCKYALKKEKQLLEECDSVLDAIEEYMEFIAECRKSCKYEDVKDD